MDRTQSKKFLLYIEPELSQKAKQPVDDQLTQMMMQALGDAKKGTADYSDPENPTSEPVFYENDTWRGSHVTPCGNYSDTQDYKLLNGMITNSLAPFYLRWYRDAISEAEMDKVNALYKYYVEMGFFKDSIPMEGAPQETIYTDEKKTAPSPDDPKKQVERELSWDEEAKVDLASDRMLPPEERKQSPQRGPDFQIERW